MIAFLVGRLRAVRLAPRLLGAFTLLAILCGAIGYLGVDALARAGERPRPGVRGHAGRAGLAGGRVRGRGAGAGGAHHAVGGAPAT